MRVVRFYVSCPASPFSFLLLRRTLTASTRSQCSPLDPNNKHRIRAFPAGPPPRSADQCSPLDLNHKESPKTYQIECQKKCQKICQIQMPDRMSNRMPKYMPERMSYIVKWSVRINMPYILPDGISETMSEFNSGSGWGSHSKKVIRNGKTMGK